MTPHQIIIRERFGGLAAMAESLKTHTDRIWPKPTVQGWDRRGFIPSTHHDDVLGAGQRLDPPLRPEEFFDEPTSLDPKPETEAA